MKTTDTISALAGALINAQSELQNVLIRKTGEARGGGNFAGYKYAELQEFLPEIVKILRQNALVVVQSPETIRDGDILVVKMITRIFHGSGEWIETECGVPALKIDPQAIGSAITYARRYAVLSALGLIPTDDDDDALRARSPEPAKKPADYPDDFDDRPIDFTDDEKIEIVKIVGLVNKVKMNDILKSKKYLNDTVPKCLANVKVVIFNELQKLGFILTELHKKELLNLDKGDLIDWVKMQMDDRTGG